MKFILVLFLGLCATEVLSSPVCKNATYCQTQGDFERVALTVPKAQTGSPLCSACIQFSEQGINILLNQILNVGVVGSCGKLCSALNKKAEQTACNLVCDYVGVQALVQAINHTDLDPIYFCEVLTACPKGNSDAKAAIANVAASPTSGPAGTKFDLQVTFEVTNALGVGQIRATVAGPTDSPVDQGFINQGFAPGSYTVKVTLDTTSDADQGTWKPGQYTYGFELCQGECGSKHPGSMVFGVATGEFTVTEP